MSADEEGNFEPAGPLPEAKVVAVRAYDFFAEGKLDDINELFAEDAEIIWYGDKGKEALKDGESLLPA